MHTTYNKYFCIYIPPRYNRHMCISHLNSLLTTYTDGGIVIVGDINENILHESEQKCVHNFQIGSEFTPHIKVPTTGYGNLLDHIYTRDVNGIYVEVQDCYYSDHDNTFCSIKII